MRKSLIVSLSMTIALLFSVDSYEVSASESKLFKSKEYITYADEINDYYDDLYREYAPEFKAYFEELGLDIKVTDGMFPREGYTDNCISCEGEAYMGSTIDTGLGVFTAQFSHEFSEEDVKQVADGVLTNLIYYVDPDVISVEGFDYKSSVFYPMTEIIFGEDFDYSTLETFINNYYLNDGDGDGESGESLEDSNVTLYVSGCCVSFTLQYDNIYFYMGL